MTRFAEEPSHIDAARVFSACAAEAEHVSMRFSHLERVLLMLAERTSAAHDDPVLQEAMQEIDMIAQHIETLRVILSNASQSEASPGLVDIEGLIRTVRLEVVARRLFETLAHRVIAQESAASGDMELL